jgi:UPF0271 protein
MASEDVELALDCIGAIQTVDPALKIMAMASTALETAAASLRAPMIREVYADRAYNDDGTLVTRGLPGAMIEGAANAADRVVTMVEDRQVVSVSGATVAVAPESVCVHGDHAESVAMAAAVRSHLEAAGVEVASYTRQ